MSDLIYSSNNKKNAMIRQMKSKAAKMNTPELKEKILNSLSKKDSNVIRK